MCQHDQGFKFTPHFKGLEPPVELDFPGVFKCNSCPFWMNFDPDRAGKEREEKVPIHWSQDWWRMVVYAFLPQPHAGAFKVHKLSIEGKL